MTKGRLSLGILLWLVLALGLTVACNSSDTLTPTPTSPLSSLLTGAEPMETATPTPQESRGSLPALTLPDVSDVVERVRPAVVSVLAEVESEDFFGRTRRGFQSGSGIIFDGQGHILTNNHVIQGPSGVASKVTITLDDGRQHDAKILGTDFLTDLAVLEIEETSYPFVPYGIPSELRVGQWIIAIGNALALAGGPTVTVGIVSALGRTFDVQQGQTLYDMVQTDTLINPGNSGGPLLNLAGEVVGINTAILRGGNVEGIGFAISMDTAGPVSQELIEQGRVRWAWLGVSVAELSPEEASKQNVSVGSGVLVTDVIDDGPASEAGIQEDDVIHSITQREVRTIRDLILLLRDFRAGDVVDVDILRDDERLTIRVNLAERPR